MKAHSNQKLEEAVAEVLNYFLVFKYAPTTSQIHTFLGLAVTLEDLKHHLELMELRHTLSSCESKYTGECMWFWTVKKDHINITNRRFLETEKKLAKVHMFFNLASFLPCIQLVGISGSCAMHNASEKDDVDVFIISAPGGIWIARLLVILTAKLLRLHRKRGSTDTANTLCFNLFFDNAHLELPLHKRNLYTAHEIVQIVPMVMRGGVYESFLNQNRWIMSYFPNFRMPQKNRVYSVKKPTVVCAILNAAAKYIQIRNTHKNRTTEIVTDEQLWFFPDDFQKKIQKQIDIHPKQ